MCRGETSQDHGIEKGGDGALYIVRLDENRSESTSARQNKLKAGALAVQRTKFSTRANTTVVYKLRQ
jgi:hypothetical protein